MLDPICGLCGSRFLNLRGFWILRFVLPIPKVEPGPPPYDIKLISSSAPVIPYRFAASLTVVS